MIDCIGINLKYTSYLQLPNENLKTDDLFIILWEYYTRNLINGVIVSIKVTSSVRLKDLHDTPLVIRIKSDLFISYSYKLA